MKRRSLSVSFRSSAPNAAARSNAESEPDPPRSPPRRSGHAAEVRSGHTVGDHRSVLPLPDGNHRPQGLKESSLDYLTSRSDPTDRSCPSG